MQNSSLDRGGELNRLQRAARAAFCIYVVAFGAMALILVRGLETNTEMQSRLDFLVNHRALWTFGWLTWTGAALAILYFYVMFAAAHSESGASTSTLRFATLLIAAFVAADLSAQAIEIGVLPDLARKPDVQLFVLLHRIAVMIGGGVANTLYSLAAGIVAWSTRSVYRTWVSSAGMAVGASGLVFSVAAMMNSATGMFWGSVLQLPSILLWLAGVAAEGKPERKGPNDWGNSEGSH
jgi:hypothetical protein